MSLLFGAISVFIIYCLSRSAGEKPAPFQLALRLADDKGGDNEDDRTFRTLHARFKQQFPKSGAIRFVGFDTDRSFIWFYFLGPDDASVRPAVLAQLDGCRIRSGSYYVSGAKRTCAPANDGPTTMLGDSTIAKGPSSV